MEIKKVELHYQDKAKKTVPNFIITYKNVRDPYAFLSNQLDNRHYWEVREWYMGLKKKPFKFEFALLPDEVDNQEVIESL